MTSVETDVSVLVESAFSELECYIKNQTFPHGGNKVAFVDFHGCRSGYVCAEHYEKSIIPYMQSTADDFRRYRHLLCTVCGFVAATLDEWGKVYPL